MVTSEQVTGNLSTFLIWALLKWCERFCARDLKFRIWDRTPKMGIQNSSMIPFRSE